MNATVGLKRAIGKVGREPTVNAVAVEENRSANSGHGAWNVEYNNKSVVDFDRASFGFNFYLSAISIATALILIGLHSLNTITKNR